MQMVNVVGCPIWLLLNIAVASQFLELGVGMYETFAGSVVHNIEKRFFDVWCIDRPHILSCDANQTIKVVTAYYSNQGCVESTKISYAGFSRSVKGQTSNCRKRATIAQVHGCQTRATEEFKFCDGRQTCDIPSEGDLVHCPGRDYNCMTLRYSCPEAGSTTVGTGPRARAKSLGAEDGQSSSKEPPPFAKMSQADANSLESASTSTSSSSTQQEADANSSDSASTSTSPSSTQQEADANSLESASTSTSPSSTQEEVKMQEDQDSKPKATTTTVPCGDKAAVPVNVKIHVDVHFPG